MAIPQSRYVSITSGNGGESAIQERDLNGLLFTKGTGYIGESEFDTETILKCYSIDDVLKFFETNSAEATFARTYFSYISPSGGSPASLSFAKVEDLESPASALSRVSDLTTNFGSFAFLKEDEFSEAQIKAVLDNNAGYNYKYLASVCAPSGDPASMAAFVSSIKGGMTATGQNGACVTVGSAGEAAAIPMAIFAAIDYNGTGTAPNFMYKRISGEKPSVFSDQVADTLDGLHVNYYGQTQANGQPLAFYQRGFNLDGEDTAVYCNEVWLKSHITAAIFNLLLITERVPANEDGESMVYTTIAGAAQQGVTNGTIEVGKTYTAAQRAVIYQLTGDAEAYLAMQNAGYWLDVVIVQDGTEYKAVYKLVYGKGDSIRKVEGSDILM